METFNADIPVINLQAFPDGEESKKLRNACEEWGCFRIINHSIPLELIKEMNMVAASLLDLPLEIKKRIRHDLQGIGYLPLSEKNHLYEALDLFDTASSQSIQTFCSQLETTTKQRETILMYTKATHELAMDIGNKIAESLGLEGDDWFKSWTCVFRINKYHLESNPIGETGVGTHTDSGMLTILKEDENVGGLEVMHKAAGVFVPVHPCPGTFIVFLGDTASIWSNGMLHNAKHHVLCKGGSTRLSMATFVLGPKIGVMEAPPELVANSGSPCLYVPIAYEEFKKLRMSKNMNAGEALELIRFANC